MPKSMKSYKQTLEEFSKRVKHEYGDKILDIILYGSAARGEPGEESDIDVAVVFSGDTFDAWKRISAIAFDVLLETGYYISVQILEPRDLKRNTPYIKSVLDEGVHVI